MFLFQSFPLGDKSSVNLRGEFHVENLTTFDDPVTETKEEEDNMEVDKQDAKQETIATKAEEEVIMQKKEGDLENSQSQRPSEAVVDTAMKKGQESETSERVDYAALYPKFWSLQQIFSNPTKAFNQDDFIEFKQNLELTVKSFKAVSKVVQTKGTTRKGSSSIKTLKRTRSQDVDELANSFNPKYLTNRDLFELEVRVCLLTHDQRLTGADVLQMSDLTFQRHILVQVLILLDFLLTLTPKGKKQLGTLKAQKAMLFNYTLSDEDASVLLLMFEFFG